MKLRPGMIKAPITTVHIHLLVQDEDDTRTEIDFTHALSIPLEDIKRLSLRPLKWLRFAAFTVCGAKGDLSATRGGEAADYENVTFNNLMDTYYYMPDGPYHFIDIAAFNDRITSTAGTTRRFGFRQEVCDRDNACIITQNLPKHCEAAHIIPCSKGSEYITHVVHDRSILYEPLEFMSRTSIDINCVQNGMLLRRELHFNFGDAIIAFLRTPNFAMQPADVPRVEDGPRPHTRTTLQYIGPPPVGRLNALQWDVQANWSNELAPPSILLDFMYGATVAQHWMSDQLRVKLDHWHEEIFSKIRKYPQHSAPEGSQDDDPEVAEQGDPQAGPSKRHIEKGRYNLRRKNPSDASPALDAMDRILFLPMVMAGRTPQRIIAEMEKREKENELRSQAHSAEKVKRWLDSSQPHSLA